MMNQKVNVIYRMEELNMTELEKVFFKKEEIVLDLLAEKKIEQAKEMMNEIMELFKFPYYEESLFYVLIEDMINICIEKELFEFANKYVSLLFISGKRRADDGKRELVAARLAYAQGDYLVAKEFAHICYKKSEGSGLKRNKELLKLLKEK